MLLTQLLQKHLARPLGAAIPACSGPQLSATKDILRKTSAGTLQTASALALEG